MSLCADAIAAPAPARSPGLAAARAGAAGALPVIAGLTPFGLAVGMEAADSSLSNLTGWLTSAFLYGGSAQIAAISLLATGAAAVAVVTAVLLINVRAVMYSADLRADFDGAATWQRWLGAYLLVDPMYALATAQRTGRFAGHVRAYYLGAGVALWLSWQLIVGAGVLAGPALAGSLPVDFAAPLLFIGLLAPRLRTHRPAIVAAVAALIAVPAAGLPSGAGLVAAIAAGLAAGAVLERGAAPAPVQLEEPPCA